MLNKFLLTLAFLTGVISWAKAQATKEVPTIADSYQWDTSAGDWKADHRTVTKYDDLGRQETVYLLNLATLDTNSKTIYLYDTMNNISGLEYFRFKDGKWLITSRSRQIRMYSGGKVTGQISQVYDTAADAWKNTGRLVSTYDAQGRRLTSIDQAWKNGAWENRFRTLADYAQNQMGHQGWDGSEWNSFVRCIDVVWGKRDGEMLEYIQQFYDLSTQNWVNKERITRAYFSDGFDYFSDSWDGINNWVPKNKSTDKYDTHGHPTFSDFQIYTDGKWHHKGRMQYIHTYDGDRLLQSLYQSWIPDDESQPDGGGKWENSTWIKYSEFVSIPAGVRESFDQPVVKVYPNPVNGILNISVKAKYNSAILLDLCGKIIKTVEFSSPIGYTIDVSALPDGYYLLRLTGKDVAPATTKVLKQ